MQQTLTMKMRVRLVSWEHRLTVIASETVLTSVLIYLLSTMFSHHSVASNVSQYLVGSRGTVQPAAHEVCKTDDTYSHEILNSNDFHRNKHSLAYITLHISHNFSLSVLPLNADIMTQNMLRTRKPS